MGSPGIVRQAAEKLKAALSAKLPQDASSELRAPILKAIQLVSAFIASDVEDMAAFEALKVQVRRVMTEQATASRAQTPQLPPSPRNTRPQPTPQLASAAPASTSSPSRQALQTPQIPSSRLSNRTPATPLPAPTASSSGNMPSPGGALLPRAAATPLPAPPPRLSVASRVSRSVGSTPRGRFEPTASASIADTSLLHGHTPHGYPLPSADAGLNPGAQALRGHSRASTSQSTSSLFRSGSAPRPTMATQALSDIAFTPYPTRFTLTPRGTYHPCTHLGMQIWGGATGPGSGSVPDVEVRERLYESMRATKGDIDWTLPRKTLYNKAAAHHYSDYDHMMRQQDMLAKMAEEQGHQRMRQQQAATLRMFDEQYGELLAKRTAAAEEKAQAGRDLDALVARVKAEEHAEKVAQQEAFAALREIFREQVEEFQAAKHLEQERNTRYRKLERMEADEAARQEKKRLERLAAQHRELLAQVKADLEAATAYKKASKAQRMADERLYNAERMKYLDDQEAKRQAHVQARLDKLKAAFERGGGIEMLADLEEQARLQKEKDAKDMADYEAMLDEKDRQKAERRRKDTEARLKTIADQLAYKAATKQAALEADLQRRAAKDAEIEALKRKDAEDAAALKEHNRLEREANNAVQMEYTQRQFYEKTNFPGTDEDMWVHAHVLAGTRRGFTNLSVPEPRARLAEDLTAAVQGTMRAQTRDTLARLAAGEELVPGKGWMGSTAGTTATATSTAGTAATATST